MFWHLTRLNWMTILSETCCELTATPSTGRIEQETGEGLQSTLVTLYSRRNDSRRNDFPERTLEMISIEVGPKGAGPFLVVAWYRPPAKPVETFTKLEKNLDFFDRENKEILILGDTNCDFLKVSSPEMDSNLAGNSLDMSNIYDLF